ncbi:Pre-mRNA-splicing factor sap61 [Coemansia asiatica]|uniref:Pre-mRNA-splicing factor sap61 n=1 Tax=Coemansia asiatica TaxID=1052880 RepID=A0A9W8CL99_9FUNG|nr:Pre-mRNA-splicing factor sap61 [Coemansia asiatica]
MNSIIEQQRQAYEDIERMELAIVDLMLQDLSKHRHKLVREQKINELLGQIQQRSKLISEISKDESGLRHKEMDSIAEHQFNEFYSRLEGIRSFYRHNPDSSVVHPPELDYIKYKTNPEELEDKQRAKLARDKVLAESEDVANVLFLDGEQPQEQTFVSEYDLQKLDTMFSGDERLGRYVDLNEQYELYLNLKEAEKLSYLEYLKSIDKFELYPHKLKRYPQYVEYLDSLCQYFEGFFARAMPLFNLPKVLAEAKEEFDNGWAQNSIKGWGDIQNGANSELVCKVCNKQFEKPTTYGAHMSSRKHQKAFERAKDAKATSGSSEKTDQANITTQRAERDRETAWKEAIIRKYTQVLATRIRDTRSNIERRQALTEEERNKEIEEEEDDETEFIIEEEDKDEQIYNPLNLPLGWDGKPIPYWLYKLHGLGVKFECEICGNAIYRGRKAFEKHFQETRHATNMRRLGIPNTRQFHGIVSIEEAQQLWERVQKEKKKQVANTDTFEEYEDSEGNVFNKKTYFDLKRQGLI